MKVKEPRRKDWTYFLPGTQGTHTAERVGDGTNTLCINPRLEQNTRQKIKGKKSWKLDR